MDTNDNSSGAIINVVEQFDYSTQNDSYNEQFRKWRKDKHNSFAVNFKQNRKESVFVEGKGFENRSAAYSEQDTVTKIMNVAGIAMLIWIVVEYILGRTAVAFFDLLGFDVHTSFFSINIYGEGAAIALILISVFKVLIPAVYVRKKLRMPLRVEFMTNLHHAHDMIGSICMAMAVSAVTSLPSLYTNNTREVFNYFRDINADASVWNQEQFIIYTIFDIIVLSVISELFFRGAIFGALRQFGDAFAIIITSVMSGLLVQDLRELPAALMISAVAAVGMLRSGSIFTAIFVQILFKMYRLALVLLEADSPDTVFLKRNSFILAVFVIGAAGSVLLYIFSKKKHAHHIAEYSSEISLKQRLIIALRSFPVPAVTCICLLAALIKFILSVI